MTTEQLNGLRIETLLTVYENVGATCEINDGRITQMYVEGGNDNE